MTPAPAAADKEPRAVPTSGKPLSKTGRKYALSAVGFVDTLGAKALSGSAVFMNALAYMVDLQKRISLKPHTATRVRTTYFSDNIGASVVLENLDVPDQKNAVLKLMRLLGGIQLYYLREFGILCRGGVALGQCFHNEDVIFGPALVEAYTLEVMADTPRIVLADPVVKLAGDKVVPLYAAEPLRGDKGTPSSSLRSIDFMRAELPGKPARGTYISQLESAIRKGLTGQSDPGVTKKWNWTAEKFRALKDDFSEP